MSRFFTPRQIDAFLHNGFCRFPVTHPTSRNLQPLITDLMSRPVAVRSRYDLKYPISRHQPRLVTVYYGSQPLFLRLVRGRHLQGLLPFDGLEWEPVIVLPGQVLVCHPDLPQQVMGPLIGATRVQYGLKQVVPQLICHQA